MKNIFRFSLVVLFVLIIAAPVLAEEGTEKGGASPVLFLQLLTLVVVGGIIYNLFISMSGFGGAIGSALKVIGSGILVLSLGTIDEVVEGITGVGSELIFGEGLLHDLFHDGIILAGFLILAFGFSKLTKLVKSLK